MIANFVFALLLLVTILFFYRSIRVIAKNIKVGKDLQINDNKAERWKTMLLVAIGQSKMKKRPIAGILHIIIYIGFIIVNFEMIEILIDGLTGTHRYFSFLPFYNYLISFLEILAILVIVSCFVFLIRRNLLKLKRFTSKEMTSWPKLDANLILIFEIILMSAFVLMNAADRVYTESGNTFLISSFIFPLFEGVVNSVMSLVERSAWWLHIVGVFAFLNYVPYSKHFHIFLAFPNVFYSKLKPLSYISNMNSVTTEVKIAMGIIEEPGNENEAVEKFGASDVNELSWKSLMDAYACTECGRCTMVCPANLTGKKLSPRKIVMDTRDRLEEYGKALKENDSKVLNEKKLLRNFITDEEIWACTTCNACAYECPVNIDPVSIILELRRYEFMEEASAPSALNSMAANIENNGAPWQYSVADRANWIEKLNS